MINIPKFFYEIVAILTLEISFIGITLVVESLMLYGLNRVVKKIKD